LEIGDWGLGDWGISERDELGTTCCGTRQPREENRRRRHLLRCTRRLVTPCLLEGVGLNFF